MKQQRGFTLIELMIVVAIIAILAAIAISQYQDYVIRAQASEGTSLADGAKTAVGEYYNNTGRFASANQSYGMALPASITGKYVAQLTASGGIIDITYRGSGSEVAVPLQDQHLLLSPIVNGGSIAWKCNHSATLPSKYLPSVCH